MKSTAGILVYDDNCPLCAWYSSLFVSWGLLLPEDRKPFSTLDPDLLNHIGFDKSRNEIPLLNPATGKVFYGVEALLEILGQRFPLIKKIGTIKPVNWLLRKLYKLVSYNRKVIVAKKCNNCVIDCTPDLNYRYRVAFLILGLLFTSLMLFPLHGLLVASIPSYKLTAMQILEGHFLLVGINLLIAMSFRKEKMLEYIGQVNMLAMLGVLLFLPLMLASLFWSLPGWSIGIYTGMVTVFLFQEYLRRMNYASILPTHTWIAGLNLAGMTGFLLFLFL